MITIPPLQRNVEMVDENRFPSQQHHLWWQSLIDNVLGILNSQQEQIAQIQAALDLATEASNSSARVGSYTVPTNVLTSTDTGGSTAKIVVASHTRVYPSNSGIASVSITGAEITGLLNSTAYYVYYDDPTLANPTPSFLSTTSAATAQVGAGASRHFIGVITTAASGGGGTGGTGGTPPGGGGGVIP